MYSSGQGSSYKQKLLLCINDHKCASASTGLGQSSRHHWIEMKPINVACDEALKNSLLSLSEVWEQV